ncbi:hypothetical protein [Halovivax cerinus]|uniref:DUF4203 domain-containing protein n=1 Tax=Halovivax cerinus TaxID=1487865 RepID=A0ABD5NLQ0_9EURY|nr:hypothetical protein [Halovivax cerinus]
MSRYRRKQQLRYGISSGILTFTAGWAIVTLITPTTAFKSVPRWKSTLWVYLGTNLIELSDSHTGGFGYNTVEPVKIVDLPDVVYLLPILAVTVAAGYTCYELRSTRVRHNISNALAAGAGYFLTGLVAMFISNVQPTISSLLLIAFVVGGGIWVGSTLLGYLSGGLPFLGIASLGSIAAIGILVLLGGIAILSAIQGLIMMAFGVAVVVGSSFGVSRQLERRGGRSPDVRFPRLRGLQLTVEKHWFPILVTTIVVLALAYGTSGRTIQI